MSIEITPLTRPLLALIVVLALANLGSRSVEPELAVETHVDPPAAEPAGSPAAWAVAVDGWHIEVDGVAVVADRAAMPELVEMPGDAAALRLERLALYAGSIGRYALEEGLDWRLVAAVIGEESAFRPDAISPAGAFGLMQVKEVAAREVGVFPFGAPDANIRAGVRYLAAMRRAFPAATPRDQQAMMLAAYNMGPGHMRDARALARQLGLPAGDWDDGVATAVRMLELPAVHARLRHGFAQGRSVVRYVDRVLDRYEAYRRQFPGVTAPSVTMIAELASR